MNFKNPPPEPRIHPMDCAGFLKRADYFLKSSETSPLFGTLTSRRVHAGIRFYRECACN